MSDLSALFTSVLPDQLAGTWAFVLLSLSVLTLVRSGRWPRRSVRRLASSPESPDDPNDKAPFRAYPALNAAERRLHVQLEQVMPDHFHPRARLLAQVSLSEFVYASGRSDYASIRDSRVDFLIVDSGFHPICAIEYQGAGHSGPSRHDQARTRQRDFNKRRALRMAGVPLVEIPEHYDTALLRDRLGDVTGRRAMAAVRAPDPLPDPGLPQGREARA